MTHFDDLTRLGQARRLRALAEVALRSWSITVDRIRLMSHAVNTLFRIDTPNGPFALRILRPWVHRSTEGELHWMQALRDSDIVTPVPQPTHDGALSIMVEVDGVPEAREVILLSWVYGRTIGDRLNAARAHILGSTIARLHAQASTMTRPPRVADLRGSVHGHGPDLLASGDTWIPQRILDRVARVRSSLDPTLHRLHDGGPCHLVHADLHGDNVLLHGRTLAVIDFEELRWGHPARDVAIATYYLDRLEPPLRQHLRAGYEAVRDWPVPEGMFDTLIGTHIISMLGDIAELDPADPAIGGSLRAFLDVALPRLERYVA